MTVDFSEADWRKRKEDYTAWWHGELDRPLISYYSPRDPAQKCGPFASGNNPDIEVDDLLDQAEEWLDNTVFLGDAFPLYWPNFGTVMAAAFSGLCELHAGRDTIWLVPKELKALSEIKVEPIMDNRWFLKTEQLTQKAAERFGPLVQVGYTDLGGSLDLPASYRTTEKLLIDLIDCPEEVKRVTQESHEAWCVYYERLTRIIEGNCYGSCSWAGIWAPGTTFMLQCDFSYMISPDMFAEFVLPELAQSCRKLDYAFYHMDGQGQIPHLDHLLSIPELRGIQWIPGDGSAPPETWTDVIGKIRDADRLCQLFVTTEGLLKIVKEFGGKGFMFYVIGLPSPAEFDALLKEVNRH